MISYVSRDVEWSWRLRLPDADFVAVASALGAGDVSCQGWYMGITAETLTMCGAVQHPGLSTRMCSFTFLSWRTTEIRLQIYGGSCF